MSSICFVTSLDNDDSDEVPQTDQKGVILATAGYDHTIKLWEPISGACSRTIPYLDSVFPSGRPYSNGAQQVNRLAISPDKRFLAAAGNQHVRLYDCHSQNRNPVLSFNGHTSNVTGIAFHIETKWIATSSEDGTVKIWDLRSPDVQRDYNHGCPVTDVVIHPNQGEVISCDQAGFIKIWDLGENVNTHTLIPEEDVPVRSVVVANDGSTLIAGNHKVSLTQDLALKTGQSLRLENGE
jgi:target of rapamycin complex subunit LST8